jgi:endonuclease YncB( thermonuclease family)
VPLGSGTIILLMGASLAAVGSFACRFGPAFTADPGGLSTRTALIRPPHRPKAASRKVLPLRGRTQRRKERRQAGTTPPPQGGLASYFARSVSHLCCALLRSCRSYGGCTHSFRFYQPWKVRLRGLDAPELPAADGEIAKAWLEERLNEQPFVVITTTKVGMYGRYITDVFCPPPLKLPPSPIGLPRTGRRTSGGRVAWSATQVAKRGRYLNGVMVTEGVALRM